MVLERELYESNAEAESTALFSCKKDEIVIVLIEALLLRSVCGQLYLLQLPAFLSHCSLKRLRSRFETEPCAALFIIVKGKLLDG